MINDNTDELYNMCANVCKNVYLKLKEMILGETRKDVLELCKIGNDLLKNECDKVYKEKDKNKNIKRGVLYPVSISLNNCVGGYIYEEKNDLYNNIKYGDVIKIDMGVYMGDALVIFGETFINKRQQQQNENEEQNEEQNKEQNKEQNENKYIKLLDELSRGVLKQMKVGNLNDDVKMYVESKCSEMDCVTVENCTSYEQRNGMIRSDDSKWIILNYTKYYDENDRVIVPNDCYEFEEGEVYNINLTIVKAGISEQKNRHDSHIYRFNDYFYNLRLQSSREFLRQCKGKNGTAAFDIREWKKNPRWRMGIKECVEGGILEDYPIMYEKENVFTKKFTVKVGKRSGILFK